MTSMVSRDDVEDQLYRISSRKADIDRIMFLVDKYAVTMAHKIQPTTEWRPNKWAHLKPGQTDVKAGMRRCLSCADVKKLTAFGKQKRSPMGRKVRCLSCRPSRKTLKPDEYYCKRCDTYKHISEFPEKWQLDRKALYNCNDCQE